MAEAHDANHRPAHLDLNDAMALVGSGAKVVASPGCGAPSTLLAGLAQRSHEVAIELFSGLQIDGAPFLADADLDHLHYRTWHVMGPVRALVEAGRVHYVPVRASEVPRLLGLWGVDVTLLRVSPADHHGFHYLGPSCSYPMVSALRTPVVIAEIDPAVPMVHGTALHRSHITATVESSVPMPHYAAQVPDDTAVRIVEHLMPLLPTRPALQLGIGVIPEAVTAALLAYDLGPLRFVGMATDAMVDVYEAGRLDTSRLVPDPAILAAELMGGPRLMAFAHDNPLVGVFPSTWTHNAVELSRLDRLVSINTAIEIDVSGQVNAETVGSRQVSGIGGSIDYAEAAYHSEGGLRVLALPATTPDGSRSRIVSQLGPGSAVTVSRSLADIVVTEFGVAELRGRSVEERRRALAAVAHPDFRDQLAPRRTT